jgi:hypothetical protein
MSLILRMKIKLVVITFSRLSSFFFFFPFCKLQTFLSFFVESAKKNQIGREVLVESYE